MACTVDWSSLPFDLVRRVADVFLTTSDVDYYMSLRAVCHNWRTSTDDPRVIDPRFHPRRWVMILELAGKDSVDDNCLFLHVDTGRFVWKDVPILRNSTCIASTEDGLLVLEAASMNSEISILNPFTGHLVSLPVTSSQFHGDSKSGLRHGRTSMFAAGSSPMVLYSLFGSSSVGCIDPTWDLASNREMVMKAGPVLGMFAAMVPFKGRAYTADMSGSIAVVEHNCRLEGKPELTSLVTSDRKWMQMQDRAVFLVDNAGDLLLVRVLLPMIAGGMEIFRVDVENGVLEEIWGIGNRAFFLGKRHCLSVDANNLPDIESNCVYYMDRGKICTYYLNDRRDMKLLDGYVPEAVAMGRMLEREHCTKSLERVLMEYADDAIMPYCFQLRFP